MLLLTTGLVLVPQVVGTMKQQGSYDWFRALPAPRSAFLFADITTGTLISLPGVPLALVVASFRYELTLAATVWAAPLAVAVAATAAMVGYAIATALPPRIAPLLTQVLVFVILLFSPITFAAETLPDWLSAVHRWLPMEPMADLLRAQLVPDSFTAETSQMLVLTGWGIGATALTLALMSRRT